ncbi:TFIIH complex serine/threonine-protein kinase subunit kin28 [Elasticomyces elasticus]|nr:TFIIH complex serine/threonine-protein kinase subunit kin28 [Elasticomyces elasticus]
MALSPAATMVTDSVTKAGTVKLSAFSTQKPLEKTSAATIRSHESAPLVNLADQLNDAERRKYVKGKKLGSGQYADVFSAHLSTNPSTLYAIKKIKVIEDFKDGITYDSLREIRFLQELRHPNIILLHTVYSTKNQNLNLVLEYLPGGDLLQLIQDIGGTHYGMADIKAWMAMLCRGVYWCHSNFVLHRDIKPNNLLIAASGEIKLADFGLARSFADPAQPMTYNTITKWYRPPELYYQAAHYGSAVDVWSVGCVFAELVGRRVFLGAIPDTDVNMVGAICNAVGTPTEDNWPGVSKLRGYIPVDAADVKPVRGKEHWMQQFRAVGELGVDLMMRMFALDPNARCGMEQALRHPWWTAEPRPSRNEDLPRRGGGARQMGDDLKRRGGELPVEEEGRADKVARKLDFGAMKV